MLNNLAGAIASAGQKISSCARRADVNHQNVPQLTGQVDSHTDGLIERYSRDGEACTQRTIATARNGDLRVTVLLGGLLPRAVTAKSSEWAVIMDC